MPEFNNREEYERWKEERLRQARERREAKEQEKQGSGAEETKPQLDRKMAADGLTDIDSLLNQSWAIFKKRISVLLPLQLLSIAFVLAITLLFAGAGAAFSLLFPQLKSLIIIIAVAAGITIGLTAMLWPIAALVIAVTDQTLTISGALDQGWKKLWSFMWLFSVVGYIAAGGYLLFIVPGIIFTVWFIFSQFILASENIKGMDAMLKSKEYVKDRWFDVCLRMLVVWAISIGINMMPFIGFILSIVATPFFMIYTNLVYEDLKASKPQPLEYVSSTGEKMKWIGIATLGFILIPLIIIAIAGAVCMIPLMMMKGLFVPHQAPQRFF